VLGSFGSPSTMSEFWMLSVLKSLEYDSGALTWASRPLMS